MIKDALARLCFHEAAHAVVALASGAKVVGVAVWERGDHLRGACYDTEGTGLGLIAGMVGEALLFGESTSAAADAERLDQFSHAEQDALSKEAVALLTTNFERWKSIAERLRARSCLMSTDF